MERNSAKTDAARKDAPLTQFSQCHVGILTHLQDLGRLPPLVDAAAQARRTASGTLKFFRDVIYEHHAEEEKELFPAVLASAARGEEHKLVRQLVDRLTREHRRIEAAWTKVEPALKEIAKGREAFCERGGDREAGARLSGPRRLRRAGIPAAFADDSRA